MKLFDPTNDNDFEDPASGTLIGGKTVQDYNQIPLTPKEIFRETDLDESGNYDVQLNPERSYLTLIILNKNQTDELLFSVNGLEIDIPPGKSFGDNFDNFSNVHVTGDNLNFTAYIKG